MGQDGGKMAAFLADRRCAACHLLLKSRKGSRCSGCNKVYYCDAQCQSRHWAVHKPACKAARKRSGVTVWTATV